MKHIHYKQPDVRVARRGSVHYQYELGKGDAMKDGICPRCGSDEVYVSTSKLDQRSRRVLAIFSHISLDELICCSCGLVETYLADTKDVEKIKANCTRVKMKS